MQGRLGDIDDDITQKLMILLSIQVLLISFTSIVWLGYLIKILQVRRSMREIDLATQIEKRLGKITPMSPKKAQMWYERTIEQYGEDAHMTMEVGVNLANVLVDADRWIEAERLLKNLYDRCLRVHGSDIGLNHTALYHVESALRFYQTRIIKLKSHGNQQFEVLSSNERDCTCTVRGPTGDDLISRHTKDEETFTIDPHDILFSIGTPVICHGLEMSKIQKIQNLQGKIGVVMSWESWINPNKETGVRYEIKFEDKNLKRCFLGEKFVRVLFDLPASQGDCRRNKMTRM
mmetsp:Transcript_35410/g.60162  ORF Transcript_35410/g.60162 Transcript_35410/m.60162 type:complete len:290 (-) Transcript_35410:59-928(-)